MSMLLLYEYDCNEDEDHDDLTMMMVMMMMRRRMMKNEDDDVDDANRGSVLQLAKRGPNYPIC